MQLKEYKLRSGPFGRNRKLILSPEFVEYDVDDQRKRRINKSEIADFKHGMDWIVWYRFTVGSQFMITFRTIDNKELKIKFASFFGIDSHFNQIYADIVEDIWQYYHQDIVNQYLARFHSLEELTLKGVRLENAGIRLHRTSSLVPWQKVTMTEYYNYFALHDRDKPSVHARISYNEYETEILWSLVKTILEEKGITSSSK